MAGEDLSSLSAQPSHPSSLGVLFLCSLGKINGRYSADNALFQTLPVLCPLQPPGQSQVETHLFFQLIQEDTATVSWQGGGAFSHRMEATNGQGTDKACEIPNPTAKNNIINYGSLQPPPARHRVVCLLDLPCTATLLSPGPQDSSELRAARCASSGDTRTPRRSAQGYHCSQEPPQEHPAMAWALRSQLGPAR